MNAITNTEVIPTELNKPFARDGRWWRVSAIGIGFIIGTARKVPVGCAVESANDIIRVNVNTNMRL